MDKLFSIIENFRNSPRFARLYVNNILSPIQINYNYEKMEIHNLQEFYKYILIPIDSNREKYIKRQFLTSLASEDRENWRELGEEESRWLQIFQMWDPIFFLSKLNGQNIDFSINDYPSYTIDGYILSKSLIFHH